MAQLLRKLVSQNKVRHQENGCDLDLTYLTESIIAMGLPATGKEAIYRNPLDTVVRFLHEKHGDRFKVFNLCNERSYDVSRLGNCACFPFDDHGVPPLVLIGAFCASAKSWLLGGMENVVVVHCKAGKGRTGLMTCCLLLYLGYHSSSAEAIDFYNRKRTVDGKGLTVPSQRRYVDYYQRVLAGEAHDARRTLVAVRVAGAPARFSWQKLTLEIHEQGDARGAPTCTLVLPLARESGGAGADECEATCAVELGADVRIDGFDEHGSPLFRLWAHPSLEPRVATFVFSRDKQRSQLDALESRGVLPEGFSLSLCFALDGTLGSEGEGEDEAADDGAPEPQPSEDSGSLRAEVSIKASTPRSTALVIAYKK